MLRFIKKRWYFSLFLLFLIGARFYFWGQTLSDSPRIIHIALDDAIPFLPFFVIFYDLWYLYVPLPMIVLAFRDKTAFIRQCAVLFTGMYLAYIVFILFPTAVDFRPEAQGEGLFLWLCRLVYRHDLPRNVFPSLHCYEAIVIHLTTFISGPFREKKMWRLISAVLVVLICLSTVFVKQHSVIDGIAGAVMSFAIFGLFYWIWRKKDGTQSV